MESSLLTTNSSSKNSNESLSSLCKLLIGELQSQTTNPKSILQQLEVLLAIASTNSTVSANPYAGSGARIQSNEQLCLLLELHCAVAIGHQANRHRQLALDHFQKGVDYSIQMADRKLSLSSDSLKHKYICATSYLEMTCNANQAVDCIKFGKTAVKQAQGDRLRLIEAMAHAYIGQSCHIVNDLPTAADHMSKAYHLFETVDSAKEFSANEKELQSLADDLYRNRIDLVNNAYSEAFWFCVNLTRQEYWKAEKIYNKLQSIRKVYGWNYNPTQPQVELFALLTTKIFMRLAGESDVETYIGMLTNLLPAIDKRLLDMILPQAIAASSNVIYNGKKLYEYIDPAILRSHVGKDQTFTMLVERYLKAVDAESHDRFTIHAQLMQEVETSLPFFEQTGQHLNLAFCWLFKNNWNKVEWHTEKAVDEVFKLIEENKGHAEDHAALSQPPSTAAGVLNEMQLFALGSASIQHLYWSINKHEAALGVLEMGNAFALCKSIQLKEAAATSQPRTPVDMPHFKSFNIRKDLAPVLEREGAYCLCYSLDSYSSKYLIYLVTPDGQVKTFKSLPVQAPQSLIQKILVGETTGERAIKKPSQQHPSPINPSSKSTNVVETTLAADLHNLNIQSSAPAGWKQRQMLLELLHQALFKPVAGSIPFGAPIYIVPVNELYNFCWNMLCDPTTKRYLFQDHPISIVPNLKFLTYASRRQSKVHSQLKQAKLSLGLVALGEDLPETLEEIVHINQQVTDCKLIGGAMTLMGKDAKKQSVLELIRAVNLLHFATHGDTSTNPSTKDDFFADHGVLYCSDNQKLFGAEIERAIDEAGNKVSMAFLNACEVAKGTAIYSDMSLNLCRNLHVAGVTSVIASLIPLGDFAAMSVASLFYKRLMEGNESTVSALRLAMIEVLEKRQAHPFELLGYLHFGSSFSLQPPVDIGANKAGECTLEAMYFATKQ